MAGVFTAFLAEYVGEKALDWGSGKVWPIIKKHFPSKSAEEKLYTELEKYIRKTTGCNDMDVIAPVCELIYKSIDEAHPLAVSKPAYDELNKILTSHTLTIASLDSLNKDINNILADDPLISNRILQDLSRKNLYYAEQTDDAKETAVPVSPAESLYLKLKDQLENEQKTHPSFILMNEAAGLDRNLFPKGSLQLRSGDRQAELDEDGSSNNGKTPKTAALSEYIRQSWMPGQPRHITIEGEGGIGKTVALLSLASEPGIFPEQVTAVYVRLHRLNLVKVKNASSGGLSLLDAYIRSYLENKEECGCTKSEVNAFYSICRHDRNGRPQVILLLDGYNEVLDSLKRQVRQAINEWADKPGVQIITTSRTAWSCGDDFMKIKLQPLTEDDIRGYLERTGTRIPAPGDNLWRVINYPLMLTLYAHIEAVRKRVLGKLSSGTLNKEDLVWHPMNKAGDVIWNYLQKELARCAEDMGDRNGLSIEDHAVAILHTAPYIAWRMSRADLFSLPLVEDDAPNNRETISFSGLVRESLIYLKVSANWPEQLIEIINKNDIIGIKKKEWVNLAGKPDSKKALSKTEQIARLLLDEINLFRIQDAKENSTDPSGRKIESRVQMMHQQFRDGLAAIWLCQRIEAMETPDRLENDIFRSTGDKYALPLCWREKIGRYVLKFAAEIMDNEAAEKFWEAGRVYQPSNVKFAYTMLNLMSERSVKDGIYLNDFSNLNFNGMDLRNISLFLYKVDGSVNLRLPGRIEPCRTAKANVTTNTFMAPGHSSKVNSVSISADGKRAVSGDFDGIIRVWNLDSMYCEVELPVDSCWIHSVAMSADGKRAVSSDFDGAIRVWDLESMQCEKELPGYISGVRRVSISADGKRAVSGGSDEINDFFVRDILGGGIVRIWDLDSMSCEMELPVDSGRILSVAISADGKRAVSSGIDGAIRVWDLESMQCEKELPGGSDRIYSVAISAEGKRAVSGDTDGIIRVWNLDSMSCEVELYSYIDGGTNVSISGDGKRAVSGHSDGTVCIWNLDSMCCEKELTGHRGSVTSVAVSADGNRAISGGDDETVCIWSLNFMRCEKELTGHSDWITSIAVTEDGKRVASSGSDGTVRIWDLDSMKCEKVLTGHRGDVCDVAMSADGNRAISGGNGGTMRIWNLNSMSCEKVLTGHRGSIRSVAINQDGKRAVSGDDEGTFRIWDLDSMKCEKVLAGHSDGIYSVAITQDGKRAISGGCDEIDHFINGDILIGGIVRIWDLDSMSCEKELTGHKGCVTSVALTQDGKRAVSGDDMGIVRIWNLNSMSCEKVLTGHRGSIRTIAITQDGKRAVSGHGDGTVCIWNLDSMQCEKVLTGHRGSICSIAVTRCGKRAIITDHKGSIRIWDLDNMYLEKTLHPLPGIDIIGIDLSNSIINSEEDREILRQNGAIVR